MTKTEQPVLRLKVQGPRVKRGRIAVPDLVKICQEAQAAVKRQAEALEGRKTLHPGPVSSVIQGECTLELIAIKKGSTTLEFAFSQPQMHMPGTVAIGTEALAELTLSIKSLGNGNKRTIDPGVLQSVYNLGEIVEGKSITSIQWIVPGRGKQRRLQASLTPTVRNRAGQRLSAPTTAPATIDGVLDMADFKPEDRKCRIDPPTGAPIICTFDLSLDDRVQGLLRQTVRGSGVARYAPYSNKIDVLQLEDLIPIPSVALGEGSFHNGISLVELADAQKVKPFRNPSILAGAIPPDQDVDDFLDVIYSARR